MNDKQEQKTTVTAVVAAKEQAGLALAVPDATIDALDTAAKNGVIAQGLASQFKKMFMLGAVMHELKALLTPKVMTPIMDLQNTAIGFMTDRQAGGYDLDTVRAAVIEAAVNGVSVCGNEFNIIAGRFYVTKNGFKHKLHDISGLYKNVTPGIPHGCGENGAVIRMHIEWTYAGKSNTKDIDFTIRVNRGMGADAIIGKATRKAYAWLYEEVTGNSMPEGDAEDAGTFVDVPAKESPIEQVPPPTAPVEKAPQAATPAAPINKGKAPQSALFPEELPM